MKRYKDTARTSITLTILLFVAAITMVSCKKSDQNYNNDLATTLSRITNTDYLVYLKDIEGTNFELIDVRNSLKFDRGHIKNAINIYAPDILNEEHATILNNLREANKKLLLYGTNPDEALTPFMLLYQLGFNNVHILSVENYYVQNELITKDVSLEQEVADINQFIEQSVKKAQTQPKVVTPPRKVVPIKKKKKMPKEGGC